jgi:NAD(P)-dependent dehydrogenase (short-subunit alcohol dehydrogenase family)
MRTLARLAGTSPRTDFHDRVVVITGASAGVGRATARRFARAGARVGLIARDAASLEETRAEIESIGGTAQVFAADVADANAIAEAAEEFEAALGPIDIWVNCAMVTVYSPIAELTAEEIKRVTEVTYLGYVHGTLAALKHMRVRNRGTIVQVGSALAYRGIPLQSAYCAAKHAIRGFTESLRCELIHEGSPIAVTEVHLPAINTPQFDWARARVAGRPSPVPPVFEPEEAADAILHAAAHPDEREYWLGRSTALVILGNMLAPSFLDRFLAHKAVEAQSVSDPGHEHIHDNLYKSERGLHRTRGSFGHETNSGAMLLSGNATRTAALIGACALSAAVGFALGGLLGGRDGNGSRRDRLAALQRRWLGGNRS